MLKQITAIAIAATMATGANAEVAKLNVPAEIQAAAQACATALSKGAPLSQTLGAKGYQKSHDNMIKEEAKQGLFKNSKAILVRVKRSYCTIDLMPGSKQDMRLLVENAQAAMQSMGYTRASVKRRGRVVPAMTKGGEVVTLTAQFKRTSLYEQATLYVSSRK